MTTESEKYVAVRPGEGELDAKMEKKRRSAKLPPDRARDLFMQHRYGRHVVIGNYDSWDPSTFEWCKACGERLVPQLPKRKGARDWAYCYEEGCESHGYITTHKELIDFGRQEAARREQHEDILRSMERKRKAELDEKYGIFEAWITRLTRSNRYQAFARAWWAALCLEDPKLAQRIVDTTQKQKRRTVGVWTNLYAQEVLKVEARVQLDPDCAEWYRTFDRTETWKKTKKQQQLEAREARDARRAQAELEEQRILEEEIAAQLEEDAREQAQAELSKEE